MNAFGLILVSLVNVCPFVLNFVLKHLITNMLIFGIQKNNNFN